jgi:hypothetical protein
LIHSIKVVKKKYNKQLEDNEHINEQMRKEVIELKATVESLENEKRRLTKDKSMRCSNRILFYLNS